MVRGETSRPVAHRQRPKRREQQVGEAARQQQPPRRHVDRALTEVVLGNERGEERGVGQLLQGVASDFVHLDRSTTG